MFDDKTLHKVCLSLRFTQYVTDYSDVRMCKGVHGRSFGELKGAWCKPVVLERGNACSIARS